MLSLKGKREKLEASGFSHPSNWLEENTGGSLFEKFLGAPNGSLVRLVVLVELKPKILVPTSSTISW